MIWKRIRAVAQHPRMQENPVKTPGIKKAIKEHARRKRRAFSTYTMKSQDGKTVTFNLVIIKKKKGEAG